MLDCRPVGMGGGKANDFVGKFVQAGQERHARVYGRAANLARQLRKTARDRYATPSFAKAAHRPARKGHDEQRVLPEVHRLERHAAVENGHVTTQLPS